MKADPFFRIACALTVLFPPLLAGAVPADIALCLIGLLFFAHCWRHKDWSWCRQPWAQCLLLLWVYAIVRGAVSENPADALSRALPFGRYIIFAAALAYWTLQDDTTRRRFSAMLCATLAVWALDGLWQYYSGSDAIGHAIIADPHGHLRLTGPFTKPILGIMLTWLAYPAVLSLLRTRRLAGVIFFGLVAASVALSGERMALLLLIAGAALATLLMRPSLRLLGAGCAGALALLGLIAFFNPVALHRQVDSTMHTLTHWKESPYGMLLESNLRLAAEQPVFGLGANHFRSHCKALYSEDKARSDAMCNTHPHNIWLEWLIEEGIIGLLLFGSSVFFVLRDCWRAWPLYRSNALFIGFLIAFVMRVWPFMSTTGLFSRWGTPPFWLVLGALLIYTEHKKVSLTAI